MAEKQDNGGAASSDDDDKTLGLPQEDRPMLPGESNVPAKDKNIPKTTGEIFYDRLQFGVGQVFILFFTAVIAYIAKFGKESYGPIPNVFKKFQDWMYKGLMDNKLFPLRNKGEFANRMAGAISNTMVLFHGGNLFAPVMRSMENNREKIATWANKKWGKPGEVEAGHERLKDLPKQSWWDVIKGRLVAWGIVFASFSGIDTILGKDRKTGAYRLDQYEDWFGRKVAGLSFTKTGKEIAKTPISKPLAKAQNAHPAYRFSKILALDLYATTAAILIWNFVSRLSARDRKEAEEPIVSQESKSGKEEKDMTPDTDRNAQRKMSFAEREGGKPKDFITRATEVSQTTGPAV